MTEFLTQLLIFSALNGLLTEGIKNLVGEKLKIQTNYIAVVDGMIIGVVGCFVYHHFMGVTFDWVFAICMGLANALVAMVGYDKVVQAITGKLNK